MLSGIYQGSSALSSLERWQDAVSQNISNASVAGYKAVGVGVSTETCGNSPEGNDFSAMLGKESAKALTKICFDQGQIVPSGNPMDCAIDGPGFFQVEDEQGGTIFTRNGQFRMNQEGILVDISGRVVQGTSGEITALNGAGEVRVGSDGRVFQGSNQIGQLAVAAIDDESTLIPAGGGYVFAEGTEANVETLDDVHIIQGYYEASNVSPMREMINMITLSRAYEANQRVITTHDSMLGRAISTFTV